jgi:hypothetical protein
MWTSLEYKQYREGDVRKARLPTLKWNLGRVRTVRRRVIHATGSNFISFLSAMKLTPELIAQAPSSLNPIKERELNLRGVRDTPTK